MNTYELLISSPEGEIFKGPVTMLSVRGMQGDLAVMAGHIPFVTSVVACDCKVILADESEKIGHIDGGLLTVGKDSVTLLSGSFVWK